jgi:N-acetylmuramoyl-L-alanine amidase
MVRAAVAGESAEPAPVVPDIQRLGVRVPIRRREDWATEPPRLSRLVPMTYTDRLTIHHSGVDVVAETRSEDIVGRLGGILKEHLDRNYGDVGYHFIVDYTGGVWEGRSLRFEGAHVSAQNEANVGILMIGNFDKQSPSEAQSVSLLRLVAGVRDLCGIKQHRVYGHRDLGQSACPGERLYPVIVGMRG